MDCHMMVAQPDKVFSASLIAASLVLRFISGLMISPMQVGPCTAST